MMLLEYWNIMPFGKVIKETENVVRLQAHYGSEDIHWHEVLPH